jgi:predicted 3-demethylubiquinone-9 3-methyltransferase (glyoxalase superfamily)
VKNRGLDASLSIPRLDARSIDGQHSAEEASMPKTTQKITPFLWFDSQAEEAANFYVSIFKQSRIGAITRYDDEGSKAAGRPKGSVMTVEFELDGQKFTALNGGPLFKFTEAISLAVNCENQREVDHFWDKLSAGGEEVQCGWLKDRFGVSWQVVPTILIKLLRDKDPERSRRVMSAMLKMKKLDVDALRKAYDGR